MKRFLLYILPLLLLSACYFEKKYVVGKDAFCSGLEETSEELVYCKDINGIPINGLVVEYYPSGKVLRKMHIKSGYENGLEKEYHENGKLRLTVNVVNGRASGMNKLYDENGKLYMTIMWDNGNAQDVKVYNQKGKVIASQ